MTFGMQGEMSDNRLTLEDFLSRTFPFEYPSRLIRDREKEVEVGGISY